MTGIPDLEAIELTEQDGIGILRLNRPDRANTVTNTMIREFERALEWAARSRVPALIVTGAGRHFCAGADLKAPKGDGARLGDVDWINKIEECRFPVIAAINGPAIGGGLELAMACDIRLMSEGAKVALPEVRFGGLPAGGGTQRLPRIVGLSRAKQLLWLGTELSAEDARSIGLVDIVTTAPQLMPEALALALALASRPGYAVEAVKYLVNEGMKADLRTGLKMELFAARRLAGDREKAAAREAVAKTDATYRKIFAEDTTGPGQ